jgi:hypothetical protein
VNSSSGDTLAQEQSEVHSRRNSLIANVLSALGFVKAIITPEFLRWHNERVYRAT